MKIKIPKCSKIRSILSGNEKPHENVLHHEIRFNTQTEDLYEIIYRLCALSIYETKWISIIDASQSISLCTPTKNIKKKDRKQKHTDIKIWSHEHCALTIGYWV